ALDAREEARRRMDAVVIFVERHAAATAESEVRREEGVVREREAGADERRDGADDDEPAAALDDAKRDGRRAIVRPDRVPAGPQMKLSPEVLGLDLVGRDRGEQRSDEARGPLRHALRETDVAGLETRHAERLDTV